MKRITNETALEILHTCLSKFIQGIEDAPLTTVVIRPEEFSPGFLSEEITLADLCYVREMCEVSAITVEIDEDFQ